MKIKLLKEGAVVPKKEFKNTGGYDLFTPDDVIVPEGRSVIRLGFSVELDKGIGMFGFARSGASVKGVLGWVSKAAYLAGDKAKRFNCDVSLGLIDEDYRGECGILIHNYGLQFFLPKGSSFAQAVFIKLETPVIEVVDKLNETERNEQGFNA